MRACPVCKKEYAAAFCPLDGVLLTEASPDTWLGQIIGNYRLHKLLGAGGMGSVYEAHHLVLPRRVAIKLLHPAVVSQPNTAQRFVQEAKIAAALQHPNIVQILDFGQRPDHSLYLVMELLEGKSLASWLSAVGALPVARILSLLKAIGAALSAAHQRGVVHRDLKPDNIFLAQPQDSQTTNDAEWVVKLLDFGLAKILQEQEEGPKTVAGTLLGTPLYMSPEQITGGTIDVRSDIYSLGVILYEALCGAAPFRGERWAVLSGHMLRPPPPMSNTSPKLQQVVFSCLEKSPEARPQSAAQVITLFEEALGNISEEKPLAKARPASERRQMTALACVLLIRNRHGEALDPEELTEVLGGLKTLYHEILQRHGGALLREGPEGFIGLFGYPTAHEDDARRAAHAARALFAETSQRGYAFGAQCSARIGLHTSMMLSDATNASNVLGEALIVASKLAGVADQPQALCSKATRGLLDRFFVLEGAKPGPEGGELYWLGKAREQMDSEELHRSEIIGRAQELALLQNKREQSEGGQGQVVLISGEPGIGKSRLLQSLREQISARAFSRLECACSPQYQGSAFYPVASMLRRLLAWGPETTIANKVSSLEALLGRLQMTEEAALFAPLLSLPEKPDVNPQEKKQRTLDALVALFLRLSEQQPVLLFIEDAHWIDPSTLLWLSLLIEQSEPYPLFLVLTHRPEFLAPWGARPNQSQLALGRLLQKQSQEVLARVTQNKTLPKELEEQILAKADGVPLFIEELTRSWLESGVMRESGNSYVLLKSLASISIPVTLQDSLMARLDRLGTTRSLAQLGAVIGREFSHQLLGYIYPEGEAKLQAELQKLLASGLLQRRGASLNASYVFKHALIQDVAYQSLVKATRQAHHQSIAKALELYFPEHPPEIIARHYTEAGEASKAIEYWHLAGKSAMQRVANTEAITHFQQALFLLEQRPQTTQGSAQELEILLGLGAVLMASLGYGADEVGPVFQRAVALGRALQNPGLLIQALFGYWLYCILRGELGYVRSLSGQILEIAEASQNTEALYNAHFAEGSTRFWVGDFAEAVFHKDKSIEYFLSGEYRKQALMQGRQDPQVFCLVFASMALLCAGYPAQATQRIRQAVAISRELKHNHSLVLALEFKCWIDLFCSEERELKNASEEMIALSSKYGFVQFLNLGQMLNSIHRTRVNEISTEELEAIIAQSRKALGRMPRVLCAAFWILPWQLRTGQLQEGLAFIEQESFFGEGIDFALQSELEGLRAEFLWAQGLTELAEASLQKALSIAQRQQAKTLELRTWLRFARLYQTQNRLQEILSPLRRTYEWFTEGHGTADLKAAKDILDTPLQ